MNIELGRICILPFWLPAGETLAKGDTAAKKRERLAWRSDRQRKLDLLT